MHDDPHDLDRFVQAQDEADAYSRAVAELRGGRKTSHWMWFVFPQVAGLGHSPMSRRFAIASLEEAQAYLGHGLLGPRLLECTGIVAASAARSSAEIFGAVDGQKLRSSMTLFHRAAPDEPVFGQVLVRYFGGEPDPATDEYLERAPEA